jgi:hypothetical protein
MYVALANFIAEDCRRLLQEMQARAHATHDQIEKALYGIAINAFYESWLGEIATIARSQLFFRLNHSLFSSHLRAYALQRLAKRASFYERHADDSVDHLSKQAHHGRAVYYRMLYDTLQHCSDDNA